MPVDTRNLRHPQRDFAIIAAAGPVSNLLQAIAAAILYRVVSQPAEVGAGVGHGLAACCHCAVQVNLLLAFFNLIPGAAARRRQRAARAAAAQPGASVLADSGSSAS